MSADFDADIAHRIKAKGKPAALDLAPGPSRIEEFGAEIAKLCEQETQLDELHDDLKKLEDRPDEIGALARSDLIQIENQLVEINKRRSALDDLVSFETPRTLREAFLLMLLCGWRHANAGEEESEAVGRLLNAITLFLEEQSDVTAEGLGLGRFIARGDDYTDEAKAKSIDRATKLLKRAKTEPYGAEGAAS